MKKPTPKLMVRRENLRVLTRIELTGAAGGDSALVPFSGAAMCPASAVNTPQPGN
jgi:hypothetical protein